MTLKRRNFIQLSTLAAGTGLMATLQSCRQKVDGNPDLSAHVFPQMTEGIQPISKSERETRIQNAQRLLTEQKIGALVLDAGTALTYFTGIRWWPSERPMVAILPASGEVRYVCPGFEEERLSELITIGTAVYAWQEDESPYEQIVRALKDAGAQQGDIGIEERVRFFIADGIQKVGSHFRLVSADQVSGRCRLIKSAAELALMQVANDITVRAIMAGISSLTEGMSPSDFSSVVASAHTQMGADHDFAGINFGEASALPHGSSKPQKLEAGDVVLMDCGCRVSDYSSDISRTIVFGAEPSARQREIWDLEKEAQSAGFAAAKLGEPCEAVDAAARAVLTKAGFGPDYKLPGLPHRTGHGIGMDGHEWGNMVRGNHQLLEPGMCFSIEPNISIPGEFGMRLEDCVFMTNDGPNWFSQPSPAIDKPFA